MEMWGPRGKLASTNQMGSGFIPSPCSEHVDSKILNLKGTYNGYFQVNFSDVSMIVCSLTA